jgi:hypothetical protein
MGTAGGGNRQPVTSPPVAQRSHSTTMVVSLAQPETRPVILTSRSTRWAGHSPMPQMLQTATASGALHWSGNPETVQASADDLAPALAAA